MAQVTPTLQSSVFARPIGVAPTVSIVGGMVPFSTMTPKIPIDAPSRQETKEAFTEVSSTFKGMTEKYGQMQGYLQVLVSTVAALKQAQQGEVESLA